MATKAKRGGARPDAGRPCLGAEKMARLSISIPPDLKQAIMDGARAAEMSVSAYLRLVLQSRFDAR